MNRTSMKLAATVAGLLIVAGSVNAEVVQVDIYGTVEFNQITAPGLGQVQTGEEVHISLQVSSESFVNSIPGDINGYFMSPALFSMDFSGGQSADLAAGPAFFGVIDGFPVSDGFFVSASASSPGGVPLTQSPYQFNFSVGYNGSTLSSLDILDALGTYDFTGLTNYGFTIWAFSPDNVLMEIEFDHMTIAAVPAPASILAFIPLLCGCGRRRQR